MRQAFVLLLVILFIVPLARGADADAPPPGLDQLRQRIERVIKETDTPAIGVALVNRVCTC